MAIAGWADIFPFFFGWSELVEVVVDVEFVGGKH
ncbi:hypothetical protein L8106_13585 [Lyngbya sp. PCC 8106]|nr:hypothetical protein L8106_13585 [Lyngbya sp. PCC 8106]